MNIALLTSGCFLLLALNPQNLTIAAPYQPQDDTQVLLTLQNKAAATATPQPPETLAQAVERAWDWITLGREQAQPRYYGYAEALLQPWWHSEQPSVLLIRATLAQNRHDFTAALADLERVIRQQPRNAQAWLTRSVIQTVTGQPHAAIASCQPLLQLTDALLAATCLGNAFSLSGQATQGYAMIQAALKQTVIAQDNSPQNAFRLDALTLGWAYTVLAEISVRQGQSVQAEQHFQQALQWTLSQQRRDPYLLMAYADYLIAHRRYQQVSDLLQTETQHDGLLLRLAIAEQSLHPEHSQQLADTFASRWQAIQARGEQSHLADAARFLLLLRQQPESALHLAQANWSQQREPNAALILLQCAQAAQRPDVIETVQSWLQQTGLEDVRLQALLNTGESA